MSRLRVYEDLESLSQAAATALVVQVREVVDRNGRCSLVLTGGRTPRRLYEILAKRFKDAVPWARVDVFWGDERYVPPDDSRSNYRMARLALLDHVPLAPENIHPIPTHHVDPQQAAAQYEALLRDYFIGRAPRFDLLLLGLAGNGHVASLFPHQPALHEQAHWMVAAEVPADPPQRITMTFPLINQAVHIVFLVAGPTKAEAVRRAHEGGSVVEEVPAAGVKPQSGNVTWWLDAAAAALLGSDQRA